MYTVSAYDIYSTSILKKQKQKRQNYFRPRHNLQQIDIKRPGLAFFIFCRYLGRVFQAAAVELQEIVPQNDVIMHWALRITNGRVSRCPTAC